MPEFKYRGILKNGSMVKGEIIASNRSDVIHKLKASKVQPITVKVQSKAQMSESKKKVDTNRLEKIQSEVESQRIFTVQKKQTIKNSSSVAAALFSNVSFGQITDKDVLTFTNSLYILKKAKFNNVAAFESLYNSTHNKKLRAIIEEILVGIQAGASINEMMAKYPKVFPGLYVNFVRVGEESGSLDTALLHARDYMESNIKLRKQLRGILLPKIILFFLILIATFIALLYGTPLIQNVYDMFGVNRELPAATRFAIALSDFILDFWYLFVLVIILIVVGIRVYLKSPIGRYHWDKFKIKAPVFGKLILNIISNKFFQAMLLNLKNGLRLQESLDISKVVTDNYYFLSLIETAKHNLQSGGSWIEPFEADEAFPPMATEMLKIGMEADLVEMMDKVSEYVEQEINESIQKTVKVLPEIMYVFVGVVLIVFVVTIMIPLVDVYMGGFLFDLV